MTTLRNNEVPAGGRPVRAPSLWQSARKHWLLYLLLVPGIVQLLIFKVAPLFGLAIAFQNYSTFVGIWDSPWVGLEHFHRFFNDPYIYILVRNTVLLALITLLVGFPIPIVFALFLNEIRLRFIKKFVQIMSFFPYFISAAVMVSILYTVLSPQNGIVNQLLNWLGLESVFFMASPAWFRPLYATLHVWHTFGYFAIVYLASMTTIDPSMYEAAEIDGAGRWKKMFYVTLPSLAGIITVMFIVSIGNIFTVDLDKILLMYNPSIYETADVIQSYVYRQAFAPQGFPNYSFGAAVSLVQSVIALVLVLTANQAAKRYSSTKLF
ncbi:ABC transporter permease [Cohnella cellulosilytica]|uniref:ABC transporter permease n=1 Tax=Cohnella cellulosilytica TaxID=986710 RepID=A0ABW2F8M3_9BACL